jgi:uncharacterized protein
MSYDGPCIDPDVHHQWKEPEELIGYFPKNWQKVLRREGHGLLSLDPPNLMYPNVTGINKRLDTFPSEGGPPGSDYSTLKTQLLDRHNVKRVVLTFDTGQNAALRNPHLAVESARAANDWTIDRWLDGKDERLYGAMLTPNAIPEEAAKEIRRVGRHPRIVEVLMDANPLGVPFGHPLYRPIHEAAAELGLPIVFHIGMDGYGVAHPTAGGLPGSRLEFHTLLPQAMIHNLVSFITHGVFERFPSLKLFIVESGVAWIPWLLWTLDSHYKLLRLESPWVKRLPSEYIFENVRITTQPLEDGTGSEQLVDLLRTVDGIEELLCFASDYPHWDADDPYYVARKLPQKWLPKIFYENSDKLQRWPGASGRTTDHTVSVRQ